MDFITLLPLISRFRDVSQALLRAVAGRVGWRVDAQAGVWAGPGITRDDVLMLAYRRIARAETLLRALVARMQAGTLRIGRTGPRAAVRVGSPRGSGMDFVTRRFAWLCPLVPSEAATRAQYLRQVLAEPAMVALVAEVPQAKRILTPVLFMLGIRLETLALEVAPLVEAPVVPAPSVSAPVVDHSWADAVGGSGVVRAWRVAEGRSGSG